MLEHVRVLDLSDERGLLCGRLLADLGADVVQVEPPGGSTAREQPPSSECGHAPLTVGGPAGPTAGEHAVPRTREYAAPAVSGNAVPSAGEYAGPTAGGYAPPTAGEQAAPSTREHAGPIAGGRSFYWDAYAANRRGVALDLAAPDGRADLDALLAAADILITSWPLDRLVEHGLDPERVRSRFPHLVHTAITPFGLSGPKAGYADSDLVLWAAGGPLDPHREGDGPPLRISVPQAYLHAAADAAAGALIAYLSGRGQLVDVSVQASLGVTTLGRVLADAVGDEKPEWQRQPVARTDQSGSGAATSSAMKKWACRDGVIEFHLAMGPASGGFTNNFFAWLRAEDACDPRFAEWDWRRVPERIESGELTGEDIAAARSDIRAFFAAKTKAQVLDAALERRLLCVGIAEIDDIAASAQLAERDFWSRVGEGDRATTLPGRFAHITGSVFPAVRRPAPLPGEHTAEVRAQWTTTPRPRPADDPHSAHPRPADLGTAVHPCSADPRPADNPHAAYSRPADPGIAADPRPAAPQTAAHPYPAHSRPAEPGTAIDPGPADPSPADSRIAGDPHSAHSRPAHPRTAVHPRRADPRTADDPGLARPRPAYPQTTVHPQTTAGRADDALAGLRVLDLSWVVAGPLVGRALADFGAEVVRVESARRIETSRLMPPFHGGVPGRDNSALFGTVNAGKHGLTLDLGTEDGRAVARDLADWADVVIESFSPGLMRRWGLDYETLRARDPRLIMLSSSLMGQTGPYAMLAGYGSTGASLSGFQNLVGFPDEPPVGTFGPYTDYVAPRLGLVALLAALERRERTGEGCYIDVSQVESGVYFLSPYCARYFADGTVVRRRGNADEVFAPHGVYPCLPEHGRDRFVALTVRDDAEWARLAHAMDRPDLAGDPDLATAAGRRARSAELDRLVGAWTASRKAREVEELLQAAGVPAHLSANPADFAADPALRHRGHLVRLPHPLHGETVVEGPRYVLSETPGRVRRPAPTLGRDNEFVLREILGYPEARVRELTERGVLT
ncbi:CoA transferase [Actinoallomurus sp. CA-150999]|uniref:CaiB/BaiF CoA-transferase family protein n=1 Tax=Actinoallomurus sp. CA-150999 TaxID=3239887 RepID=UPI003D93FA28